MLRDEQTNRTNRNNHGGNGGGQVQAGGGTQQPYREGAETRDSRVTPAVDKAVGVICSVQDAAVRKSSLTLAALAAPSRSSQMSLLGRWQRRVKI